MRIINRSKWPTWAVKVLAKWVLARFDLPRRYTLTVKATSIKSWRGTGWHTGQTVKVHRRYRPAGGWPYTHRYITAGRTRTNFPEQVHRSRVELLVGLMAHEARHSDRTADEIDCEMAECRAIEDFRKAWPEIQTALKSARRAATAVKPRPDLSEKKLILAESQLADWQRKAKLARTKIAKYSRKVKYYSGKIAAKRA